MSLITDSFICLSIISSEPVKVNSVVQQLHCKSQRYISSSVAQGSSITNNSVQWPSGSLDFWGIKLLVLMPHWPVALKTCFLIYTQAQSAYKSVESLIQKM